MAMKNKNSEKNLPDQKTKKDSGRRKQRWGGIKELSRIIDKLSGFGGPDDLNVPGGIRRRWKIPYDGNDG